MAVRYAALIACQKVHVCHCNSLDGATWRSVRITGRTDRQTDRRTDRVRRNMRPPPREEGRIITEQNTPITTKQVHKINILHVNWTRVQWLPPFCCKLRSPRPDDDRHSPTLLSMNDCNSFCHMPRQSLVSVRQLRRNFDDSRPSAEGHPRWHNHQPG